MKIKFQGFSTSALVTIAATQNGITRGPVTISAWKASSSSGTFDAYVSDPNTAQWRPIVPGEVIEMVAPGRMRVMINNFAGWGDNDPRNIWVDTDYGERWTFESHSDPDLPAPTVLRRLAGSQAGYYPGIVSGHAMLGTDMSGNQLLTANYNAGPGPVGTIDKTVTVTVTDGLATAQVSFTVRLIHPERYHADRTKATYAPTAPEENRRGTIYVSADGDFSGAPAVRAETATVAGIYHVHANNDGKAGAFTQFSFRGVGRGFPWNTNWPQGIRILFKGGQTFFLGSNFDPSSFGGNCSFGAWGTGKATWDCEDISRFDPVNDGINQSGIGSNAFSYQGWRFSDIKIRASGYNPSDITWREWWNIINVSNLVGTIGQNTQGDLIDADYNGEFITNAAGVRTQVVKRVGNQLICRQVVAAGGDYNENPAPAAFTNGDVLTGSTNGATMTFVAAGSRQNRTRKTPGQGIFINNSQGVVLHRMEIEGASTGIGGLGANSVISDTVIRYSWNYGAQSTAAGLRGWSESGVVTVQPLGYEGTFRFLGQGQTVSRNRNAFNVVYTSPGDAAEVATNDVSHSYRRIDEISEYSAHYCGGRWFGGHGGAPQPLQRFATAGSPTNGIVHMQVYGCFLMGGNSQIQFSDANPDSNPYTPYAIRIERNHFLADFSTGGNNVNSFYSNYVLRNNLFEHPAIVTDAKAGNVSFVGTANKGPYPADVDAVAVSPVIEFNTFVARVINNPKPNIPPLLQNLRGTPVIWRNNAFAINTASFGTIDADVVAMNDTPQHFDSQFRPTSNAIRAYQTATGLIPGQDGGGVTRPGSRASKGAFEP